MASGAAAGSSLLPEFMRFGVIVNGRQDEGWAVRWIRLTELRLRAPSWAFSSSIISLASKPHHRSKAFDCQWRGSRPPILPAIHRREGDTQSRCQPLLRQSKRASERADCVAGQFLIRRQVCLRFFCAHRMNAIASAIGSQADLIEPSQVGSVITRLVGAKPSSDSQSDMGQKWVSREV